MKRAVAVLVIAILSASCSGTNNLNVVPKEELPDGIYRPQGGRPVDVRNVKVTVFFVSAGSSEEDLRLVALERSDETTRPTADFAMEQLLKGPSSAEIKEGLRTAIPPGTRLVGLTVEDELASLNFAGEFEAPAEDIAHQLRIAQIVWTLTSLAEIKRVRFLIHGVAQSVIDQDGKAHDEVARPRYSDFAPTGEGPGLEP